MRFAKQGFSILSDDAQAGYEGGSSTTVAVSTNANFVIHTSVWLLNGMCTSPSKLVRESLALENINSKIA